MMSCNGRFQFDERELVYIPLELMKGVVECNQGNVTMLGYMRVKLVLG